MSPLVDTHAHLHDTAFDGDRAAVLARARAAGVAAFLTIGTDVPTSEAAVALAQAEPDVYAAVAYILNLNGIIREDQVIDASSLPKIVMPNRNGFIPDPRPKTRSRKPN